MSEQINRKSTPERAVQNLKWLALWLLILALAFAWRAQNLDAFGLSNDEGAHLMWARLAVDGYPLYSETYAVQAPLFLEAIGLAFRLAGPTIQAGRWAILPSFGLLAAALSWLAYRSGGWPAALTAVILVSLAPLVFTFSRLAMAEVPATALAVTSVVFLFLYLDRGHKAWLLASGLTLGLSFITKMLNPFVVAPIGWLLLVRSQRSVASSQKPEVSSQKSVISSQVVGAGGQLLLDGLLWSLGLLIPLAVVPLVYDPAAVYDQLIRFRSELRAAVPSSTAETWTQFQLFINSHWGFWLLAFGGIMAAGFRAWEEGWQGSRGAEEQGRVLSPHRLFTSSLLYPLTWLIWLLAGIVMLGWHAPLFPHHFIVLLPPLILLGAELISYEAQVIGSLSANGEQRPAIMIYSLIIMVAALNLLTIVKANRETAAIVTGGREAEALKLLRAVSTPDDFVMGDSQLLIFMADRRTPPPLGDVALVAIKAGRQTSERMLRLTEQVQAPAVVQWSLRLPWLPDYLAWVQSNYLARRVWDNDHIIYFGLRLPPGQTIPNEKTVRLSESVALRGYQIEPGPVKPGQHLNLKVYWQTDMPLAENYTVFTQLLNNQGVLATSWDSQPLGGYFPTSQWPAGEIVTDIVRLPLPADLAPGNYSLITGMYRLDTQERLRPATGGNDFVALTTLNIE
ncbi:MAG: glycosyltransferase family 39 protein [Anaerolineales bacterium]|nr:glycosyltransferase family 39 protein [Anaerolineales bacterium]